MTVISGYKQTEIGVIPEDWFEKRLSSLGTFSKGSGVRKDEAQSGNLPCVRYGELYTRHNDYIKQFHSFISRDVADTAKKLKLGDILFAGSGETKAEIGKSVAFVDDVEAFAGGDIVILSPLNVEPLYLGYLLNAPIVQKQKASRGQGDAVVHISANQLGHMLVPIPATKSEQTAIATALSDADALISGLEKLIAKKRNIKQGAMQKLLQPKSHWHSDVIANLATITTGAKNTQDKVEEGDYPFFVRSQTIERINSFSFDGEAILVAGDGVGTGKVMHYYKGKFDYHQRVYKISDFESHISGLYFFLYFKNNFFSRIMQMTAKSSVDSIRRDMISRMTFWYPSITEQVEISTILTDMDNEITSLEAKLEKYRNVKFGMMQNLLTGKIRLV